VRLDALKPVQIGLLVVAGALGGAIVMKVAENPRTVTAEPELAPALTPANARVDPPSARPEPASAVLSTPSAQTPEPAAIVEHPSPFAAPAKVRETPRSARTAAPRVVRLAAKPAQVTQVAENRIPRVAADPVPVRTATAEPEPVPASGPAPSVSNPVSNPVSNELPPARTRAEDATPHAPAAPEPARVTLNAGILIPVRLVDGLSAERNQPGDSFTATLDKELVADGFVIAERGARVEGRVVKSDRGARLQGSSALQVELVRVHLSDGQTIQVRTDPFERRTDASHREDAEKIGAGAVLGAMIGGVAAGGKGAAVGAGVGGAAGAGAAIATHNKPAALPSETRLAFRLRFTLTITERVSAQ
jgi:hypothetical protein